MGVAEMRIIRTTEAPRWVQNAGDACLTFEEYYDEALLLWEKYAQGEHTMDLTIWQFGTLYPRSGFYTLTAVNSCAGEYRSSAPVCKGKPRHGRRRGERQCVPLPPDVGLLRAARGYSRQREAEAPFAAALRRTVS